MYVRVRCRPKPARWYAHQPGPQLHGTSAPAEERIKEIPVAVSLPTIARDAVSGLVNQFRRPSPADTASFATSVPSVLSPEREAAVGPIIRQLVWAPALADGTSQSCPTLGAIDAARGPGSTPFASAPNAAQLEMQARDLIDRYWSEMVWLTGLIDQARFETLCASLERMCPAETLPSTSSTDVRYAS
jgi:hypothetical protein